jgi:hypothetical protein
MITDCKKLGHIFANYPSASSTSSEGWKRLIYYCQCGCPAVKVKIVFGSKMTERLVEIE